MRPIFCVATLKIQDEPQKGCSRCQSCYDCPIAHVKIDDQMVAYRQLSLANKALVRGIEITELRAGVPSPG